MAAINRAPIDPNHHKGLIAADEITGEPFAVQGTSVDGSINVNAIITPSGEQDVNLTKVGGTAVSLGQGLMTASIPVTLASNQTALPASQSGTWTVTANAGTNLNTSALALESTLSTLNAKFVSGTDIGDVTINNTSLAVTGTFWQATQPISAASLPLPTLAATSTIQTDGTQKTQIVDAGGEQVTVTGGKLDVNATISGSGGGTSAIDDSAFTAASDSGTPMMGFVTADAVDSGDVGVVGMDVNRNLKIIAASNSGVDIGDVTINNAAGAAAVNIQDGGNTITVDGTIAATQSGTWNIGTLTTITNAVTVVGNAANGAAVSGNPVLMSGEDPTGNVARLRTAADGDMMVHQHSASTILADNVSNTMQIPVNQTDIGFMATPTVGYVYDGTTWDRMRGDATDGLLVNLGSNNDVTVASLPLPSGAATSAAQTDKSQFTKITDGTDTALVTASGEQNVLESNSAAIKTAVETIDNAISGSEMQVDVVASLPAGTNAIGKLAANSGVDIGDVDVTSAVSGTLDHGSNLDIDTTAEQITSTSFACKFGLTLRAPITNTGVLYIGNSDVTAGGTAATDGIPLYAGESITIPVSNSNIPYAIASANNQVIYWFGV